MSIFSETMKKAISIYRGMLRRYLPQAERVSKLHELNLKNPQLYQNDIALYHTGHAIVADIQKNLDQGAAGYYSYSGVGSFGGYLKGFLDNYEVEGSTVIHQSQKASRALIQAIQLLTLPREKLTHNIADKLDNCGKIIAYCGSPEQRALHVSSLQSTIREQQEQNSSFYRAALSHFQEQLQKVGTDN